MSKQKINSAQKSKLLDLISSKPQLRTGKFSSSFTHKDAQKQWEEIARQLNAIPGANKDWKAWRKTWQDYLSKTKSKSAAINKIRRGTGGGPPPPDSLDDFEEGVAALIHPHSISGHTGSSESSVIFDFEIPLLNDVILSPPIEFVSAGMFGDENVTMELQPPQPTATAQPPQPTAKTQPPQPTVTTQPPQPTATTQPPQPTVTTQPPQPTATTQPPQPTATTQPPQTNSTQTKKKKINLKTLLAEKLKLKKDMFEIKKKWYEEYISNMERQTRALEDISRSIQNFHNSSTSSQHNNSEREIEKAPKDPS